MILMNNKMLTFIQRKGRDSIRLSMKLSEILKAGVREMDGCYFLNIVQDMWLKILFIFL